MSAQAGSRRRMASQDAGECTEMSGPFFFLHVPKTGGTSFIARLRQQFAGEKSWFIDGRNHVEDFGRINRLPAEQLNSYRCIAGHFTMSEFKTLVPRLNSWTLVAMLRHPLRRFFSAYQHLLWDTEHPMHKEVTRRPMRFVEYVQKRMEGGNNRMAFFLSGLSREELDAMPEDEAFSLVVRNIETMFSFVGVLEDLEASTRSIMDLLGFEYTPLERLNTNRLAPKRMDATAEEVGYILQQNRLDLRIYEYVREGMNGGAPLPG
jgi:hypothetical protein